MNADDVDIGCGHVDHFPVIFPVRVQLSDDVISSLVKTLPVKGGLSFLN